MITVKRVKTITGLAFPICIALSSTSMMAVIDLVMVGRLGNDAIAAVGLSVFCNMLILAFVKGISPAVQGIVARRRGEGSTEPKCLPLNGGLALAVAIGVPLSILAYVLAPALFAVFSHDPEVTKIGVPFLRVLYLSIAAEGMHNAFKGNWAGMEKPKIYMTIVLCMTCLNILLNYALIFGHFGAPAMGALGAAIGTVSSLYIGVIANFAIARFNLAKEGFLKARPEKELLGRIFKMGIPSTMQEFFFSLGSVVLLGMIGKVGTSELAAATPLIRIMMVLTLLSVSLGMASATLVSKTVGEGDPGGAAEWGWDTAKLGVIGITLLGLPLLLYPKLFLAMFLTDPHTISIAVLPLQLIAATTGLWSLIYIFAYTLYSVGDGKRVMMVSFSTQWLFFLPAVWFVGPYLRFGLPQIWMVATAHGAISTAWITAIWAEGNWKKIKI
jgi:putative MATE family efflux protein